MSIMPFWVGTSRIEAARLAEREKCAQVVDRYIKELSTWTSADDHALPQAQHMAVIAVLQEAARRIRDRK
jgi:hypothetical protein